MKNFFTLCVALLGINLSLNAADIAKDTNWHHWRGPNATGASTTAKPPIKWSEKNNIRWKIEVEGFGTSTPIVWGNKVFILTAINTGVVDPSLPKPEDQPTIREKLNKLYCVPFKFENKGSQIIVFQPDLNGSQ